MKLFAVTMAVAMLLVPAVALSAPSIVGNFQGWNPADPATEVTLNGNGVYTLTIAAGDSAHFYKAVDGDAWGQDFPGANQTFTPASPENVTFFVNLGAVPGTKEGDEYVFHSLNPPIVCGDFMSELGGTDWDQTDTSTTVMSDPDLDDIWEFTSVIPSGAYNFKIVLNNNWDQNTSPAGDIPFGSNGVDPVLFRYHMATNTIEVFTTAPPALLSARIPAACPTDTGKIELRFSKDMETVSVETEANYAVTAGLTPLTVVNATQDLVDPKVVVLEVSPGVAEGDDCQVVATGVTDTDLTPIDPTANDACFYVHKVVFELNMGIYIQANGVPTTVHIQGDTYPLTWDQCVGCEAYDDGASGGDVAAGDSTYTVTEYFSMQYDCGAAADSAQVKYKYVLDCTTWEGDYDFGHFVDLDPNSASQTMNVWWEDVAPVDNISCDVGVLFQLNNPPACQNLYVRGTELPLDWSVGVELLDDGTGGDVTASDGIYSATAIFPTGTYRFLEYKYFCADSDTSGIYECDLLPNRMLELDDVNGCMALRAGPMVTEDLWNWCEPVTGIEAVRETSWGTIKSMFRVVK